MSRGRVKLTRLLRGDSFGPSSAMGYFCQPTVLVLYLAYASYYLPRKADSVVKTSLVADGFSVESIALSDTVYLFTYTVTILFSGMFGSRISSNKLLAISLLCIAIISSLKAHVRSPSTFIFLQIIQAIFQSTGWPTCIKVLSVWVVEQRGLVMGMWTTCQSLGGVIGAVIAAWFLSKFNRKMAYLGHTPVLLLSSYLCYHYVLDENPNQPSQKAQQKEARKLEQQSEHSQPGDSTPAKPVTLTMLCTNPNIMAVGVSYFFLKV